VSAVLFNEEIAAHYENWYETRKGKRYDRIEKSLLARALEDLQPDTLLEVGCGTGHFTHFFAKRGWTVTGIDIALPMIERARVQGVSPVFYVVADAAQLPFKNNSFEVVVLVATLEILENPVGALTEAFRVARRGLVIGFLNKWSFLALYRKIRSLFRKDLFSGATFYSGRDVAYLLHLAAQQRGKVIEAEKVFSSWIKAGRYGLLGTFGVVGVTICSMPLEYHPR